MNVCSYNKNVYIHIYCIVVDKCHILPLGCSLFIEIKCVNEVYLAVK